MNGLLDGTGIAQAKTQVEETLFLSTIFCGEDDHRASLLCLPHPHPNLPGDVGPAHTLMQKQPLPAAPLQKRNTHEGRRLLLSPINVIKRIKLLERASFSFSFYLIREIPTARFVQMKPRLLPVVRQPREDALPFNLAR